MIEDDDSEFLCEIQSLQHGVTVRVRQRGLKSTEAGLVVLVKVKVILTWEVF